MSGTEARLWAACGGSGRRQACGVPRGSWNGPLTHAPTQEGKLRHVLEASECSGDGGASRGVQVASWDSWVQGTHCLSDGLTV